MIKIERKRKEYKRKSFYSDENINLMLETLSKHYECSESEIIRELIRVEYFSLFITDRR